MPLPDLDRDRIREILLGHPQAGLDVYRKNMDSWIERVARVASSVEEAEWHARRVGGFGGSDANAVLSGYLLRHPERAAELRGILGEELRPEIGFLDDRKLIRQKLLCLAPEEVGESDPRSRGKALEPYIREKAREEVRLRFIRWLGDREGVSVVVEEDRDAMEAAATAGCERYPWLRFSPDDVVRVLVRVDGQPDREWRFLLDYKAPSEDEGGRYRDGKGIPMDYLAQLAHGALYFREIGFPVSRAILGVLDYRSWSVLLKEPDMKKLDALISVLPEAGEHHHRLVLSGVVPPPVRPVWDEEFPRDVRERMTRALRMREAAKRLEEMSAGLLESVYDDLLRVPPGHEVSVPAVQVTFRESLDEERLGQEALGAGLDPAAYTRPGRKPDLERIREFLELHGVSLEEMMTREPDLERLADDLEARGISRDLFVRRRPVVQFSRRRSDMEIVSSLRDSARDAAGRVAEFLDGVEVSSVGADAAPAGSVSAGGAGADVDVGREATPEP